MYSLNNLILRYLRVQESFDDFLKLSIDREIHQWSCEEIEEEVKYWEHVIEGILIDCKVVQTIGVQLIRGFGCISNSLEIVDHLSYVSKDILFPSESKYHLESFILRVKKFTDDPETINFLKDLTLNVQYTLNDHYTEVRRAAVILITKGWKDDPDILPLLKDRALNDRGYTVRSASLQEIAQGWKDDPQTFDFLCDRAIHDPFERKNEYQNNPRQTALKAILQHYSDKPQTLELLKAISNNDPDEKLKEFAKEELAKLNENPVGA